MTNICGQGAGTIVVGFGLLMGLLFVDNKRKRLLQFPEV